jgi:mono/diheme cytochrome c family protein
MFVKGIIMERQQLLFNLLGYGVTFFLMTALGGLVSSEALAQDPSHFPPSIKESYAQTALPILQRSCFACHGPQGSSLDLVQDPSVKKRVEKIIASSQEMLQMEETFPFSDNEDSHAELKDLVKTLKKGWMPPPEQKKYNLGTPLNDADKKILQDWAEKTMKSLERK